MPRRLMVMSLAVDIRQFLWKADESVEGLMNRNGAIPRTKVVMTSSGGKYGEEGRFSLIGRSVGPWVLRHQRRVSGAQRLHSQLNLPGQFLRDDLRGSWTAQLINEPNECTH